MKWRSNPEYLLLFIYVLYGFLDCFVAPLLAMTFIIIIITVNCLVPRPGQTKITQCKKYCLMVMAEKSRTGMFNFK
jgi:hypothetical protein